MNATVTNLLTNSSNPVINSIQNINNTTLAILQYETNKIDPNWFYSSSAQCAAAIVGLMGAFLVTKLINQKAFVNQLNNEITDYKNKMKLIDQEITPKIEFLKDFEFEEDCKTVGEYLNSIKYTINPDHFPSLDQVYEVAKKDEKLKNITKEAFNREYDEDYRKEVKKTAIELVNECFKNSRDIKHLDISNPPDTQVIYDIIIKDAHYQFMSMAIFKKKYIKFIEKKKREGSLNGLLMLENLAISRSKLETLSRPVEVEPVNDNERIRLEKYSSYKDDVRFKKAEISHYEGIIKEKEELLEFNKEIPRLKINISLLFLFSVLGVFLPLYMLLLDDNTMLEYRFIVLLIIFIGWIFILFNLGYEIWGLMGKGHYRQRSKV